ncbi:MAG: hypothetical protein ABSG90_11375 [Dehalococcoidia bacterium]|jgi:hypothetical protein
MANHIKEEIAARSSHVLQKLRADSRLSQYIPTDQIPDVFTETDDVRDIRLIVIGQDPTVKSEASRSTINTVLNLDKHQGCLYGYLSHICNNLGLDLKENVYATNFAKNFFKQPPTLIKERDLLKETSPYWLPLLHKELWYFPGRLIVTLGQPLLKVLLLDPTKALVRVYWGYYPDWIRAKLVFSSVPAQENKLDRELFPLPHQPSSGKKFYRANLQAYLNYVKRNMART